MPTYVYACKSCEDRTEVMQKMSDAPLTECGKCGGSLRRVLFPPAVVYKGSGFYTTDYKNGGRKSQSTPAEATSDSAASDSSTTDSSKRGHKSDSKGEIKSETKTETKSETKSETTAA